MSIRNETDFGKHVSVTEAAVYFASDEARFVAGQVLVHDSGQHIPA